MTDDWQDRWIERRTARRERRRRFLDRYEARRQQRLDRGERVWMRPVRIVLGSVLLLLALLVGWVPGPGGMFFAVPGALLLAGEIRWFALALDRGERETVPRIRAVWRGVRRGFGRGRNAAAPELDEQVDSISGETMSVIPSGALKTVAERAGARLTGGVQVAAHRGFHDGVAPYENTMDAFVKAMDHGADMVELDVHRTLDGVMVVHHDAAIAGTEITKTRLLDLPKVGAGVAVPRLDDVVDLAADRGAKLLVELKESGYEQATLNALNRRLPVRQFDVFSFHPDAVRATKELQPDVNVGLLIDETAASKARAGVGGRSPDAEAIMAAKNAAGADFLGLRTTLAHDSVLAAAHKAGTPVYVWTANDATTISRLVEDGRVATVISDHPDVAMRIRDAAAAATIRA